MWLFPLFVHLIVLVHLFTIFYIAPMTTNDLSLPFWPEVENISVFFTHKKKVLVWHHCKLALNTRELGLPSISCAERCPADAPAPTCSRLWVSGARHWENKPFCSLAAKGTLLELDSKELSWGGEGHSLDVWPDICVCVCVCVRVCVCAAEMGQQNYWP